MDKLITKIDAGCHDYVCLPFLKRAGIARPRTMITILFLVSTVRSDHQNERLLCAAFSPLETRGAPLLRGKVCVGGHYPTKVHFIMFQARGRQPRLSPSKAGPSSCQHSDAVWFTIIIASPCVRAPVPCVACLRVA